MIPVTDPQASGRGRSSRPLRLGLWLTARLLNRAFRQGLQRKHAMAKMTLYWMCLEPRIQPSFEYIDGTIDILL
jgi:hypothetical protein